MDCAEGDPPVRLSNRGKTVMTNGLAQLKKPSSAANERAEKGKREMKVSCQECERKIASIGYIELPGTSGQA